MSADAERLAVRAEVERTAGRSWRWHAPVAFALAFGLALAVTLTQGPKPFYYDSGVYWALGETFIHGGHFSLLNFESPLRGYSLPLLFHGLQAIAEALGWQPSSLVKLMNTMCFALIGAVLTPRLAELAWPTLRWGLMRRLLLTALLIGFWNGFLNFPLSDFPALTVVLVALIAAAGAEHPVWMASAGLATGLAIDMRPSYVLLAPIVLGLMAWGWYERRGLAHTSATRRAVCLGLALVGFAVVSLPQSLSSHRHYGTWSFLPGSKLHLSDLQLTAGLLDQRYDTYVGPDEPAQMSYEDRSGARLLHEEHNNEIMSSGQYLELTATHPLAMGGVFARHLINGLDPRYSTVYIENLHPWYQRWMRLAGSLLVFLALVRIMWPAARRSLGRARWRYPVGLLLCCATAASSAVEARYMLPAYLLSYVLVLAPGWPNPLGSHESGWLRSVRTPLVMIVAYAVFLAVVWHVTSGATDQLHFG